MKKMRSLFMAFAVLLVGCASTSNVGYVPNRVEKNMLLPDGAKGDVLFSQHIKEYITYQTKQYANHRLN